MDELAQRRAAKAAAAETPMTALEAIEHGDRLLVDLVGSMEGQLLVPADDVREVARQVDRILLGLRTRELSRAAR